jgi:hypothetical protein
MRPGSSISARRRHGCALALLSALAATCSGGSPSAPSPGAPGSTSVPGPQGPQTQSCRTYASVFTGITTAGPLVSTIDSTCTFSTATNQGTCNLRYSDTLGGAGTATTVASYQSRGDFIDEVRVVPPLTRSLGGTTRITGSPGGLIDGSVTNHYDGQGRLIRQVAIYSLASASGTIDYTAWDAVGRPTAANLVGPSNDTMDISYNDAARTMTTSRTTPQGQRTLCTMTYDANGNHVGTTCEPGSNQTLTIAASETVCR